MNFKLYTGLKPKELAAVAILLLGAFFLGMYVENLPTNKTVEVSRVQECRVFYETVKKEYWSTNEEGRVQVIYNPDLHSCLVANFNNTSYIDGYYDANVSLRYTQEEYKDILGYDTRSFGMIVDLNKGAILTHYIYESEGGLAKIKGCHVSYQSIEKQTLFGKKEIDGCDDKKDLFNAWVTETERYGFSKWEGI